MNFARFNQFVSSTNFVFAHWLYISAIIEAKDLHSKVKPLKEALLQVTSSIDRPSTKKPAPFKFIKVIFHFTKFRINLIISQPSVYELYNC